MVLVDLASSTSLIFPAFISTQPFFHTKNPAFATLSVVWGWDCSPTCRPNQQEPFCPGIVLTLLPRIFSLGSKKTEILHLQPSIVGVIDLWRPLCHDWKTHLLWREPLIIFGVETRRPCEMFLWKKTVYVALVSRAHQKKLAVPNLPMWCSVHQAKSQPTRRNSAP